MDEPVMKTIKWRVSMGLVGCYREGKFKVEADADFDEIDEMVRERALDEIEWSWRELED